MADLDHRSYIEDMCTEEYYTFIIGREFGINPVHIFDNWDYEDIYKTMAFLRYEAELEKKEYDRMSKKKPRR